MMVTSMLDTLGRCIRPSDFPRLCGRTIPQAFRAATPASRAKSSSDKESLPLDGGGRRAFRLGSVPRGLQHTRSRPNRLGAPGGGASAGNAKIAVVLGLRAQPRHPLQPRLRVGARCCSVRIPRSRAIPKARRPPSSRGRISFPVLKSAIGAQTTKCDRSVLWGCNLAGEWGAGRGVICRRGGP